MGNYLTISWRNWWYSIDKQYLEPLAAAERSDSPEPRNEKVRGLLVIEEDESSESSTETIEL